MNTKKNTFHNKTQMQKETNKKRDVDGDLLPDEYQTLNKVSMP